jgi:hypothetical protein
MVKLEELEDEHFVYKSDAARDGALLEDDDDDYTDTGTHPFSFSIIGKGLVRYAWTHEHASLAHLSSRFSIGTINRLITYQVPHSHLFPRLRDQRHRRSYPHPQRIPLRPLIRSERYDPPQNTRQSLPHVLHHQQRNKHDDNVRREDALGRCHEYLVTGDSVCPGARRGTAGYGGGAATGDYGTGPGGHVECWCWGGEAGAMSMSGRSGDEGAGGEE